MNTPEFTFERTDLSYQPFDLLTGHIQWNDFKNEEEAFIRLFWITTGSGTSDIETVYEKTIKVGKNNDIPFSIELPAFPYSYESPLITIEWHLEFIDSNDNVLANKIITISPTGLPIQAKKVKNPFIKLHTRQNLTMNK